MKYLRRALILPLALLVSVGCDAFGEAMNSHTDVVARAAGKELRVEEAAELLAASPQVPAEPQIVGVLANLWVDYILLATAAEDDPDLAGIDLDVLVKPAREELLVSRLRERVITIDTAFTDEQLAQRWASEGPGAEIRARHILLRVPGEATDAQRDSVRALAGELRQRAVGGADFAALATEYSQDPGSAQRGGDLGFFGRGRMVAPFDEAAFQLEAGEISEVVETPFGYHVIRMEERRQAELGEQREQFRGFLAQRAVQEAENSYVDSLTLAANMEIAEGGREVVREIGGRPETRLRGRAAQREIASYQGGELTAGEFAEFVRTLPPQAQNAFPTATDEQVDGVIEQIVRRELLLNEAQEMGVTVSETEQDSIRTNSRQAVRQLVQGAGFGSPAGEPAQNIPIEARVKTLLQGAIAGTGPLVPLGPLGTALRDAYSPEVNQASFGEVVARMEEIRASQPAPPAPAGAPGAGVPGPAGVPGAVPPPAGQQQPPVMTPPAGQP